MKLLEREYSSLEWKPYISVAELVDRLWRACLKIQSKKKKGRVWYTGLEKIEEQRGVEFSFECTPSEMLLGNPIKGGVLECRSIFSKEEE